MKNKMRPETILRRALNRQKTFSARGSSCPICGKGFRHGCDHSIVQAEEILIQRVANARIQVALKQVKGE